MLAFHTDRYALPLPPGHRFPADKYARLRSRVEAELPTGAVTLREPPAATDEQILRAHTARWLRAVTSGDLLREEQRDLGLPWSVGMVERARRSAGATLEACRAALASGIAVHLAGGTHHAHADRGGGFCVFNDAAIALRAMLAEGLVRSAVVIDCDVHQGDGTATILAGDARTRTFSIHGRANYPFRKATSDLDIELEDGTTDEAYLEALDGALARMPGLVGADLAIYLAGADPWRDDRLGRLALSKEGLAERDRRVLARCARAGVPVAVCMAGGYARDIEDTVDIHVTTVRIAAGL
ncbi:MAG: histone deacetylase [Pseudomonadota bacterium]